MPRAPRLQFDGAFYHVFHRGNRRQPIYQDDQDYARFESIMLEAMRWSGVELYSWKQMPNHFHLLVQTPSGNLSHFMQRLLTRYAMYVNRRYQQVGHVFQGRYGARVCDKESYFKELIRYIQLNAYRTRQPLAKPGEWKWSSHRYLMMPSSQWPEGLCVSFRQVLERFGEEPRQARQTYATFLADGLKDKSWRDFYKVREGQFVGDEVFVQKVKQRGKCSESPPPVLPESVMSADQLIEKVVKLSGLSREILAGPSRKSAVNRWRKAMVHVGRYQCRLPVNKLGQLIGRGGSGVSHSLFRMAFNKEQPEIKRLLESLGD